MYARSSLFVSHGAPSLLLDGGPSADFLKSLGKRISKPKAVICLSAHWESREPLFTSAKQMDTIHDFYGFPEEMYRLRYPAMGNPELAQRGVELCKVVGIDAGLESSRGLDHGAWVPLMALFPDVDVPVVQVSLPFVHGPRAVYALGKALEPLKREGVLLLGSGGFTHNLGALAWGGGETPAWASEFHAWTSAALRENRLEDLFEAATCAPHFSRNHPRVEHWLPLFFALGAGGHPWGAETLHTGFEYGSLAMDAFAFSPT